MEYTFVQIKGLALFQGGIIAKKRKYIYNILKSSSPEPQSRFQPKFAQSSFWVVEKFFFSNGEPNFLPRADNNEIIDRI